MGLNKTMNKLANTALLWS